MPLLTILQQLRQVSFPKSAFLREANLCLLVILFKYEFIDETRKRGNESTSNFGHFMLQSQPRKRRILPRYILYIRQNCLLFHLLEETRQIYPKFELQFNLEGQCHDIFYLRFFPFIIFSRAPDFVHQRRIESKLKI